LGVPPPELVGGQEECADPEVRAQEVEQPDERERRLTPTEGVEDVEGDLAPLEEARGIAIAHGDAVPGEDVAVMGAEGKAVRGRAGARSGGRGRWRGARGGGGWPWCEGGRPAAPARPPTASRSSRRATSVCPSEAPRAASHARESVPASTRVSSSASRTAN